MNLLRCQLIGLMNDAFNRLYLMNDYDVHLSIDKRVHLIRGANNARFPEANSLFIDDQILTLIDAGSDMGHIIKTMRDLGHRPEDLDLIVLSHFHVDHKNHASQLQKMSGCEIICHPLAERGVRSFQGLVEYYGISGHRLYHDWQERIGTWLPEVLLEYEVTGTFADGRPIELGETTLYPVHTPGHTIDHTCFGINGYQRLMLVDIDLTRFGPWYGNAVSDIEQFKQSIQRVIDLRPQVGISSHLIDPVSEGLERELQRFLSIFDERERRILRGISEGYDTVERLASRPTIYPRLPLNLYYVFEEFMIQKHVDQLLARKKIALEDNRLVIVDDSIE